MPHWALTTLEPVALPEVRLGLPLEIEPDVTINPTYWIEDVGDPAFSFATTFLEVGLAYSAPVLQYLRVQENGDGTVSFPPSSIRVPEVGGGGGGGLAHVAATVSANGTLLVAQHNPVDASGGARTMTLPIGTSEGTLLSVEKVDGTGTAPGNVVNVTGSVRGLSAQTIALSLAHESVMFVADAAGSWWPVAGHKTLSSLDGRYARTGAYQVLPAPTGVAATDDAALSAAITALGSNGGVIVPGGVGVYAINSWHVFPNKVDVQGLGGGSTSFAGVTTFRCTTSTAGFEFQGGGGLSGYFELDGNTTATTPFFRNGGTGANARTFHNMIVHDNLPTGGINDLCKFWGAQNDYYVQCGFADADRDIAWFDQGFGGVTFERCEWRTAGRYWHRFDNQIAGGVSPWPFNIVFSGTNNLEGNGGASHVKLFAGIDITYDKSWFYSANALTGPSLDVGTGCIVNLVSPSFQSTPSTRTSGTKAISVAGTGRVTIVGRAQYLNFDKPINIDGLAAHIFDNTPPEFYNCATPTFTGTSSASSAQWENDSNGLRTVAANATDIVSIGYNAARSGLFFEDLGDGSRAYFPGTGFGGATAKWGPRNSSTAVGVPLASTVPVCLGGGSTAARPAAVAALAGATWINSDTNNIEWCNGTIWNVPPGSGGGGVTAVAPRDLPTYAPSGALHVWQPADSFYNANGSTLHGVRAAEAKWVNGDADITAVGLGDSVIAGFDGTSYHYESSVSRTVGKQLAKAVGAPFCNGIQMACADTGNAVYDNVTKGGFTANAQYLGSTGSGQSCNFDTLDPSTVIDIFVWNNAPSGMTWTIDGVAQNPITTNGTNTVGKVTSNTTLANTTHHVVFTSTAANQLIIGWWWRNPNVKQLYAHCLSMGGSAANTNVGTPGRGANWSDTTSGSAPFGLGFVMSSLVSAAGITPDVTYVSLGANDMTSGTVPATVDTGIANVLAYSWLGTTKVLTKVYKPVAGSPPTDPNFATWSGLMYTRCDTANVAMLDVDHYVNTRASASSDGLIGADGTHPTVALMRMIGRLIAKLLSTGLLAAPLVQIRTEVGSGVTGTYTPRLATAVSPAGIATGADQPPDMVNGDIWLDEP